jgi:hypothetical protein
MIITLALRSLLARPVRSAVLAAGFGLGVAVMAALLGIGGVILEQARAPALVGGGDVVIGGVSGRLAAPRFVLSNVLAAGSMAARVAAASPAARSTLYLIDDAGATPVRARGGIPSRERALNDPEISRVAVWTDTERDRAWVSPDPGDVLRAMDRFHPVPDVPGRAGSWSEWLYFNGRAGTTRFYLTFIAGPPLAERRRRLSVRLQLEQAGRMTAYSDSVEMEEGDLLASAPELTMKGNRVRLVGGEYRVTIDLPAESGLRRATGEIALRGSPGASLSPLALRGAGGWVSGYVVPVMSGSIAGKIQVENATIDFEGGTGYHDHNWGFWEGVRWQWGQVQGQGLSFVYGRIHPPPDAADAARVPGFLVALGPDGPVGYSTDVTIDETKTPHTDVPTRILVRGRSDTLALTLDLAIDHITSTTMGRGSFGGGMDFLQLRAAYRVSGRAGDRDVDFTAAGSAETFRGRSR